MDYAYRYGDERRIYLNITNRCTNRCVFCVRVITEGLGGAMLRGGDEPDMGHLRKAILACGKLETVEEFIWCGYGEPTFRLELIRQAAPWLRSFGARIRLNTNGHACLIHGRDVLPELGQSVDEVSVSLNAPDGTRYLELCRPDAEGMSLPPLRFWEATIGFISRAPAFFQAVRASVVGHTLTENEIAKTRSLASLLGVDLKMR